MQKLKVLLISIVLFANFALAQDVPTVIPPLPEAASMIKYGDIPISHYTGTANINIPLFTIEEGGYTLPISLSYHSRGIKVEEIASRVGLGWTLNYGGAITRM
ncbi:hypothetical protein EYV94_28985, partial [Puteibacter caeruleilacunae]